MVKFELRKVIENDFYFFLSRLILFIYMTLFDIAYRCCMLEKYGICNDGARSGVSVAQWCDVRFVMRTLFFFVPRSRQDE